jgi:hypothetical protein
MNVQRMANEMRDEIDNEILDELLAFSAPSAVDRLAAIADPDGEAARRIKEWEEGRENMRNITRLSNEIYNRTKRENPNWLYAPPKVMHSILGGTQVTC